jgi:hypothetical protein
MHPNYEFGGSVYKNNDFEDTPLGELLVWGDDPFSLAIAGRYDPYEFWYMCWDSWRYECEWLEDMHPSDVVHCYSTKSEIVHPEFEDYAWFFHDNFVPGCIPITMLGDRDWKLRAMPPERPYYFELSDW